MHTHFHLATQGVELTDRSGTITSGGTAQTAAASNPPRRYLMLQNTSDTKMWYNLGVTAVASQPSFSLAAGASVQFNGPIIPTGLLSVIGATTGKIFTCKEA